MKIIASVLGGGKAWNENGVVRWLRYSAIAGAIAGLNAASSGVTGAHLPSPAITIPLLVAAVAGAEKWLRNHQGTS